jgi:hypothetical protein
VGSDRFVAIYGVKTDVPQATLELFEERWRVPARSRPQGVVWMDNRRWRNAEEDVG